MSEQTKCSDNIGAHIWLGRCPACANPSAPETPAPETTEPCDLVLDAEDRELLADPPRLAALTRPETGPMQFGDDWPGIFIRGDNAAGIAFGLSQVVETVTRVNPLTALALRGVIELLTSADVRTNPTVQRARLVEEEDGTLGRG